jgi:hypothetical protein
VPVSNAPRQPSFALLFGLAWLLILVQLLANQWGDTARALGDTDDAMRLAQVRDWLSGQGWYDLNQTRVAGGYESHWSRLIDAGLAGTLWAFGWFFDSVMAERLMRVVWPLLWVAPTMASAAAIAWRIGGREAALITLLLAAIGLPAFQQFRPGRIDHHNVQIALSLLTVAATVWSDRARWAAYVAGAATALAMAIGLESLPFIIICAVIFGARYLVDRTGAQAAAHYGLALAASSVVAFFVIVGPEHWTRGVCDAIAINWVVLVAAGGLGLALCGTLLANANLPLRLGAVFATGAIASVLFLWIEPRCLRGPFGMMDPAIWDIWAAHIQETQPLIQAMLKTPLTALGCAIFPAVALLAALTLLLDRDLRRDFGYLAASAALLAGVAMMFGAIKGFFYATWLGMPLVAVFALRLFALLRLQSLVQRFAVSLFLTPAVLSFGAITIAEAAGFVAPEDSNPKEVESCFKNDSYAALAKLPEGLVATNIDYGPFLLALTPHSVLAAPYHRLSAGIIAAHDVFSSPPDKARSLLARQRVTYVMACARSDFGRSEAFSLGYQLHHGQVPAWLESVPVTGPQAFSVYRLKSSGPFTRD